MKISCWKLKQSPGCPSSSCGQDLTKSLLLQMETSKKETVHRVIDKNHPYTGHSCPVVRDGGVRQPGLSWDEKSSKSMGLRPTQLTENRKNRLAKLFRILTCQMCRPDTHALSKSAGPPPLNAVTSTIFTSPVGTRTNVKKHKYRTDGA